MTPTPFSDATILQFCRFSELNVPANLTFFKKEVNKFYRIVTICCSL